MRIDHLFGRSVADTDAMAALTKRPPAAVRILCLREDQGYDVDTCTLRLEQHPQDPVLLTAAQAQQLLGIPAGTVRQWASNQRIRAHSRNTRGHPLYHAADLDRLNRRTPE